MKIGKFNILGDFEAGVFTKEYEYEIDGGLLDYFEYADDAAAQAAYVSSNPSDNITLIDQSSDGSGVTGVGDVSDAEFRIAQSFTLTEETIIRGVSFSFGANSGTPSGDITAQIETDTIGDGSGNPSGSLAHANFTKTITPTASQWNDFIFSTPTVLAAGVYWIRLYCDNQTTNNYWSINRVTPSAYDGGIFNFYNGSAWNRLPTYDNTFKVYSVDTVLQSYSESTIKTQGSYSLKGIGNSTISLNETLTRTLGSTIDLTGINTLKFDIRSSRTGSNLKLSIHDSGGTTTELTPNITQADNWQSVSWDISGVADADKDAIDEIKITVVNADADNTFYLDNFYWGTNPPLTSLNITDIDGDVDEEIMVICKLINGYDGAVIYGLQCNEDASTNYSNQYLDGTNTTVSGARTSGDNYINIGYNSALNELCFSRIIGCLQSRDIRPFIIISGSGISGTTITSIRNGTAIWGVASTNITSINILASQANGLGKGTHIILYKKRKKS